MVEGIKLHNVSKSRELMPYLRKNATFYPSSKGKKDKTSLGSETLAYGNSGDPTGLFFLLEEYGVQGIISKETKCRCRESDSSVNVNDNLEEPCA